MSKADDVFARQFAIVLASLVVFFFVAIFIARAVGAVAEEARMQSEQEALARIQPVGSVRVAAADAQAGVTAPAAPAPAPAQVAAAAGGGADVYTKACAACHATGALNAPKVGDKGAWEPRFAQGLDTLVSHAINGLNAMPPRGGQPALSDDEIRAAVEHMLGETGL